MTPTATLGQRLPGGPVLRFAASRLLGGVLVLLVVALAVLTLTHLAPGGAEQALVGPYASAEQREAIRAAYRLDDPWHVQYLNYLQSILTLDLGQSFALREPVSDSLRRALAASLPLMLVAWAVAVLAGIALGMLSALHRGGRVDRWVGIAAVSGASTPMFATAIVLTWVFGIQLGWLPTVGIGDGGLGRLRHLVLPCLAMVIVMVAAATRITRSAVIDVLESDHVTFARSRGLSTRRVLVGEVLRNAAVPIVTQAGGMLIALFGGLVIVESIFGLDGLGTLLTGAIAGRDVPLIQGVALAIAGAIVLVNILVDVVVLMLDPRVRKGATRRG